jgi:hypothetical protein
VGYEQFLAPEIFFSPSIYSSNFSTPLTVLIDNAIQQSPIDTRRELYVICGDKMCISNFFFFLTDIIILYYLEDHHCLNILINVLNVKFKNMLVYFFC